MEVATMIYRRPGDGWFFSYWSMSYDLPQFCGLACYLYPVLDEAALEHNQQIKELAYYKLFFEGHIRYL